VSEPDWCLWVLAHFRMEFKEAVRHGLYDFENARNWYRSVNAPENGGKGMHVDLVFRWIKTNALLIAPFTPHFSEHILQSILGETTTVQNASFPKPSAPLDHIRLSQIEYMRASVDTIRSVEAVASRKKGKAKSAGGFDPSKPKSARLYVATQFPAWQTKCVELVKASYDAENKTVDDVKLRAALNEAGLSKDKKAMPFCQTFKVGPSSLVGGQVGLGGVV
jgi:leucyl-tRNA synthetase